MQVCLVTREYRPAASIIESVVLDVKTVRTHALASCLVAAIAGQTPSGIQWLISQMRPTYRDVLTYYHHAGLISAAQGDFEKAVEMFSIVRMTTLPNGLPLQAQARADK